MMRYNVTLIDRQHNFRKSFEVQADSALEAIKIAKGQDSNFTELESCILVKALG